MLRRTISAALLAAAVALGLGGTAHADNRTFTDRKRDVPHAMDIQRVMVANSKESLVVVIKHRRLVEARTWAGIYIDVDSSPGPDYFLRGGIGTHYDLHWTKPNWQIGGHIGCWYKQYLNYSNNTTVYRLSRNCLNGATYEAKSVRISAVAGMHKRKTDWSPGYHRWTPWIPRSRFGAS